MKGIIGFAVAVLVGSIILWVPFEVQVTETYLTYQPYTYEQKLVRESQVRNFPWFHENTQVQYVIKNTDSNDGKFLLNFNFDNGKDSKTVTETVTILTSEEKAVTVDSPLANVSKVTLNVIPPLRSIPKQHTVTRQSNGWENIWRFVLP